MGALHEPTDGTRAQVFALSSFGVPQNDIASFLGMSDDTLRKHYSDELRRASIDRNAQVAAFLFRSASGETLNAGASYADCLNAAKFWMKTRAGWKEKQEIEHTSPDGSMTPRAIVATMTPQEAAEAYAATLTPDKG